MSLRPNARTDVRRNRYKVSVDAEEGRRRREDNMVEIRKNKREESLQKKRREGLQAQQFAPSANLSNLEKKVAFLLMWSIRSLILEDYEILLFDHSKNCVIVSFGFWWDWI